MNKLNFWESDIDSTLNLQRARRTFTRLCRNWKLNNKEMHNLGRFLPSYLAFLRAFKRLDKDKQKMLNYVLYKNTEIVQKRTDSFSMKTQKNKPVKELLKEIHVSEVRYRKALNDWYAYYVQEVALAIEHTYIKKIQHYTVQLAIDEKGERLTVFDERSGKLILDYEPGKSD